MHRLGLWLLACSTLALACGDDGGGRATTDDSTSGSGPSTWPTFTTQTQGTETTETDSTGDMTDTDGATDESGDGTTTGSTVCPTATHRCVEEPPEDWNGPVARFVVDATKRKPPECGAAYPEEATAAFGTIVADPAQCECACDPAQEATCDTPVTVRYWSDDETCSEGVSASFDLIPGICNVLPLGVPGNGFWLGDPIEVEGGSCAPIDTVNVVEAAFEEQVVACGGAELLQGCAQGRVCAPQAEEGHVPGLCVWREGEHECPEGYDEEQTLYGGLDDGRGCEPCSCGTPEGLCDNSTIRMWENTCSGQPAAVFSADGQCHPQNVFSAQSATVNTGDPVAFCEPSDPVPMGEVTGTDPVTLCCTSE